MVRYFFILYPVKIALRELVSSEFAATFNKFDSIFPPNAIFGIRYIVLNYVFDLMDLQYVHDMIYKSTNCAPQINRDHSKLSNIYNLQYQSIIF
jgi:hypothetical protein